MSSQTTNNIYIEVMKNVINKVRDDFVSNGGPGENVLNELQESWKAKMMQIGSISIPIERSSTPGPTPRDAVAQLHDLNLPYEGIEGYENPTIESLFTPTPMHTTLRGSGQTPLPGTVESLPYNISMGGTSYTPVGYTTDNGESSKARPGLPSQFMVQQPPISWLTQAQRPSLDINIANDASQELVNMRASHQPTNQLQEAKMVQAGSILGPIERSSSSRPIPGSRVTQLHDLNLPYEGTEGYKTPTTKLLFPLTPRYTPLPGSSKAHLSGIVDLPYNISTDGTPYTPTEYTIDNGGGSKARSGLHSRFMQPPSPWLTQAQRPSLDVNIAYDENQELVNMGASHQPTGQDFFMISSGKRKIEDFSSQYHNGYISQQDGARDTTSVELKACEGSLSGDQKSTTGFSSWIPQVDGPVPNQFDDTQSTPPIFNWREVINEDYNIAIPTIDDLQDGTPTIVNQDNVAHDEDDELLNENDDDDDDLDDDERDEDINKDHLVLAQFDKVSRNRNIWRCTLKDGIVHIGNRDILFKKANGEFDF